MPSEKAGVNAETAGAYRKRVSEEGERPARDLMTDRGETGVKDRGGAAPGFPQDRSEDDRREPNDRRGQAEGISADELPARSGDSERSRRFSPSEIEERGGDDQEIQGRDGEGHIRGVKLPAQEIVEGQADKEAVQSQEDPSRGGKAVPAAEDDEDGKIRGKERVIPAEGGEEGDEEEEQARFERKRIGQGFSLQDRGQGQQGEDSGRRGEQDRGQRDISRPLDEQGEE